MSLKVVLKSYSFDIYYATAFKRPDDSYFAILFVFLIFIYRVVVFQSVQYRYLEQVVY